MRKIRIEIQMEGSDIVYNYKLIRLGYKPVFYLMFTGGICAGSIIGLLFAMLDRSTLGFLGGAFITLLVGLASGLLGFIYTLVFNTISTVIGGIPMEITPTPETSASNPPIASANSSSQ